MILTKSEFKNTYLGLLPKLESEIEDVHEEDDIDAVPTTIDWTK